MRGGGGLCAAAFLSMLLAAQAAFAADCSNPSAHEGAVIYSNDYHQLNFCNGSQWKACGPKGFNSPAFMTCFTCRTCKAGIQVGGECSDGTVFAGFSPDGTVPLYTTHCDLGQTWNGSSCTGTASTYTWNNGTNPPTITTGYTSPTTGKSNSGNLAALSNAESPYAAATACENLMANGKIDWYLPARSELDVLYNARTAIGNFNTSGTWYWSSSEYTATVAWVERFSDGYHSSSVKSDNFRVRCVRR